MSKNKGKNAFFFFMLDYLEREKAAGRYFSKGLLEVQQDPKCSEQWKNMSKQQRGYYESKAKDNKIAAQGTIEKKATDGTPLWVLEDRQKKIEEFHNTMLEYINTIFHSIDDPAKLKFIFIHSSWFCVRINQHHENDYIPAEFAVCEFSLREGIGNTYHEILKTEIPLGYAREALETSEKYHKIPIEFAGGESDYIVMFNKLINFLKPYKEGNFYPPLYTSKVHTKAVSSLLNRLAQAECLTGDHIFRVYSLEHLFMTIRNASYEYSGNNIPMRFTTAELEIEKDSFCFERNLACQFHEVIDGAPQYCSLSVVKRWGFTIADHCCKCLDIEMIPGKHCPKKYSRNELADLTSSIANLSVASIPKVLSMTGVSSDYRERVSNESYFEEQRRHKQAKPVEVIDHSKERKTFSETITVVPPETTRPLREPKTMSRALQLMMNDSAPQMDEANFPPIGGSSAGRGNLLKKGVNWPKRGGGSGRSSK